MHYVVLNVSDYRLLYDGTDRVAAERANKIGTHLAEAATLGEAQRRASMEVGHIRRGAPLPDFEGQLRENKK